MIDHLSCLSFYLSIDRMIDMIDRMIDMIDRMIDKSIDRSLKGTSSVVNVRHTCT